MPIPLQPSSKFIPNLGTLHQVEAAGVGISIVRTTIGANTSLTDAQLIAAPPNTGVVNAAGPIVHSLGKPPAFAFLIPAGSASVQVGFAFMTADNSALYFRASSFTGASPAGVGVIAIAVP